MTIIYRPEYRPNKVSKNRLPRKCPFCGGEMVKGGSNGVRQMWLCRSCKRRTGYPIVEKRAKK